MKKILIKCLLVLLALTTASCKKYLDVVPSELVTKDKIFSDVNSVNTVLAHLYTKLPTGFDDNGNSIGEITAATDESYHHWQSGTPSEQYNLGDGMQIIILLVIGRRPIKTLERPIYFWKKLALFQFRVIKLPNMQCVFHIILQKPDFFVLCFILSCLNVTVRFHSLPSLLIITINHYILFQEILWMKW